MTTENFVALLTKCPLIASVQAAPYAPLDQPDSIRRLAQSSIQEGVGVLRIQGLPDLEACHTLGAPIVGLIKRDYEGSEVRITPTQKEVGELLTSPAVAIALDATTRPRPNGCLLPDLIRQIHVGGRLAWADCDGVESAQYALESGADILSTTLCGYTGPAIPLGPELGALQQMVKLSKRPVIAEGRYQEEWQVRAALQMGAAGVVMGGALNDPHKQTARFVRTAKTPRLVLGFDIGGTWLRCGRFENWRLVESERIPLPADPAVRHKWMRDRAGSDVERIGISSGGTIDPVARTVIEAKPLIPGHVGTVFRFGPKPTFALNDGLATAYGHSCLPEFAGRRVATIALGTGVGFGLVDRGLPWMGPHGEYPRLNDVDLGGQTLEDLLGGANLSPSGQTPTIQAEYAARGASRRAVDLVKALYMPDEIILAGGVGLSDWLGLDLPRSPFGAEAGLYGAAALAIWPPFD